MTNGKPPLPPGKPWIGVEVEEAPASVRLSLGFKELRGVHIARVLPETPASLAGLKTDDILLSIDGRDMLHPRDVAETIARHKPGEKVVLQILRPSDVDNADNARKHIRAIPLLVREHPVGVSESP